MCKLCAFAGRYQKPSSSDSLLLTTKQFSSLVVLNQASQPVQKLSTAKDK